MADRGLREPPAGALAGESVGNGYDEEELDESLVEESVGLLKAHPAFQGMTDDELREIATEKLE